MPQNPDWDQLRIFLACLRSGSLRGAATALGVNHATVNRAIGALEISLGTRVFDRTATGLSLTQPGEVLVEHAEEMERQSLIIARKLAGLDADPSGTVRVSVPPSLAQGFLAPLLGKFGEAYPEIDIQVIGTNRIIDLGRHEADVSIRVAHEVADDVVGRRIVRYLVAAFASPDYLAANPGLTVGDGSGAEWIGWSKDTAWIADSPFPKARQRHVLPEIFMQLEAAAHHAGMAYVPAFMGDQDPRLVRVPGTKPVPDRSIWVLLHGDLRRTARVRAFVDFVVEELKRNRSSFTA